MKRMCSAWGCDEAIPPTSRADRIYCSPQCQRRVTTARKRARQREAEGETPTRTDLLLRKMGLDDGPSPSRPLATAATTIVKNQTTAADAISATTHHHIGGAGFDNFVASGYPEDIAALRLTQTEVSAHLSVSQPTVAAWMSLWRAAAAHEATAREWANNHGAQTLREFCLSSFENFSSTLFPDELVPDFHEEWDGEITQALNDGQRTMLLAPQRHGKTSFMVRQCLYRIANSPNIQIIIVGKTLDLAKKIVGVIRQYLENDPRFAEIFLPPDTSFRPPGKRGLSWTNEEFTVSTRTKILKSPTMVAIGIGGSILGRDADLIAIDDPIDRKMCLSPTERAKVKEWFFTDFNSRIESHTGVIYIGSRQHKEDLPAEIIKNNASRMSTGSEADWKVLIYRAHSSSCHINLDQHPEDPEDGDNDCILWPQLRTARWLAEQERNNPEHFQRNYLNNPSSTAFMPVKDDDIQWSYAYDEWISIATESPHSNKGHNLPRTFGSPHSGTHFVASVDPAVAKKNAAVLWCYSTLPVLVPTDPANSASKKIPLTLRAVVDYAEPRPGSPGVTDILKQWHEEYRVTDWVFETNYFADQIANDTDINDFRASRGLKFHTHYTSKHNKHDPRAGLLAMLSSMGARPTGILLPGTTTESQRALTRFVSQMLNYDPEATHHSSGAKRSHLDDDLLMAAWFGWYWIESRVKARQDTIVFDYGSGWNDFAPSHWHNVPWKDIG